MVWQLSETCRLRGPARSNRRADAAAPKLDDRLLPATYQGCTFLSNVTRFSIWSCPPPEPAHQRLVLDTLNQLTPITWRARRDNTNLAAAVAMLDEWRFNMAAVSRRSCVPTR